MTLRQAYEKALSKPCFINFIYLRNAVEEHRVLDPLPDDLEKAYQAVKEFPEKLPDCDARMQELVDAVGRYLAILE